MEEEEFNIEPIICSDIDDTDFDYDESLRKVMTENAIENYNRHLEEVMIRDAKIYVDYNSQKAKSSLEGILKTIEEYRNYGEKVIVIDKSFYDELKEQLNVEYINTEDDNVETLFGYELFIEEGDSEGHVVVMSKSAYNNIKPLLSCFDFWDLV